MTRTHCGAGWPKPASSDHFGREGGRSPATVTLPDDAMTIATVQINITESGDISWSSGHQPNQLAIPVDGRTQPDPAAAMRSHVGPTLKVVPASAATLPRNPSSQHETEFSTGTRYRVSSRPLRATEGLLLPGRSQPGARLPCRSHLRPHPPDGTNCTDSQLPSGALVRAGLGTSVMWALSAFPGCTALDFIFGAPSVSDGDGRPVATGRCQGGMGDRAAEWVRAGRGMRSSGEV